MSRALSNFRESDVKRALRAIEAAGKIADSVELTDGHVKITLKKGTGTDNHDPNQDVNEWDDVQ
jgi:hypothetical protein